MKIEIPKWLKTTRGKVIFTTLILIASLMVGYFVIKAVTRPVLSGGCTIREHYEIKDGVPHVTCFGKYIEDTLTWTRVFPLTVVGGFLCSDFPEEWGSIPPYDRKIITCPSTVRGGCALVVFDENYYFEEEIFLVPGEAYITRYTEVKHLELYYCDIDCLCSDWVLGTCAEKMCGLDEIYISRTCPEECDLMIEYCRAMPTCITPVEYCDNGICGEGETYENCPADCPAPVCTKTPSGCDDGNPCTYETVNYATCECVYTPLEGVHSTCSGEVGCKRYICRWGTCTLEDIPYCTITECGNGDCEADENYLTCPSDCPNPCDGMQCPDKCSAEGYYLLINGECTVISGVPQCNYQRKACPYGCDSISIKCIEPTPECRTNSDCDDSDACTTDECVGELCYHYPITNCVDDNPTACTEGEINILGTCITTTTFIIIIIIILAIIGLITYALVRRRK